MRPDMAFSFIPVVVRLSLGLVLLACATAGPGTIAHAQAGPAFGDSGWIAPLPLGALEGDPTAAGARVSPQVGEPVGETILRTPFRILFYPVRLVARGLEGAVGLTGGSVLLGILYDSQPEGFIIRPTVLYAGGADATLGLRAISVIDPAHATRWSAAGSWSLRDTRKAAFEYRRGAAADRWGVRAFTTYNYRPLRPYYGMGNTSSEGQRSIYLGETGAVELAVRLGRVGRSVQFLGGYDVTSARRGYNDSPGVLDEFTLAEAPGMLDASQVSSFGVGGDFALVDRRRDPTSGVHARFEARQVDARSGGDFDLRQVRLEARAYIPVGSTTRVIALRALHHSVAPSRDDAVIPFYRLPESAGETGFAAYSSHRFTDRHLALAHVEYRWLIARRVWALGLAQVGEVASAASRLRIADVHESYGGGLRYAFREDAVARLQVARGSEGINASLTLNGDF